MADKDIMPDGTTPGTGPEFASPGSDVSRPETPGQRSLRNFLRNPETIPPMRGADDDPAAAEAARQAYIEGLLNKRTSDLTARETIELAQAGFNVNAGGAFPGMGGYPRPGGIYGNEPEEVPGGTDEEGIDSRRRVIRQMFGDRLMNVMENQDYALGFDQRYLEQMRYQSPIFGEFTDILARNREAIKRAKVRGAAQGVTEIELTREDESQALLQGMRAIRTRVLRVMVDQFRDDSTQEMPQQVGEMIQAINMILNRSPLVEAKLEREKINHLIQGMQLVQVSSAMAKYDRKKWYDLPSNFYPHHWTTLFKIPAVLEASRAVQRMDKNGAMGVTFMKPKIDGDDHKAYFERLGQVDKGFTRAKFDAGKFDSLEEGDMDLTKAFDAITGYKIIEQAWADKDLAHLDGFKGLFDLVEDGTPKPIGETDFEAIRSQVEDKGKPGSALNENQQKLRALFMKAICIVHPDIGADQYSKPIFADVAASQIFGEEKEGAEPDPSPYESLLTYEINGKTYKINRANFTNILNQLQLALYISHKSMETLGIATQYDGFVWKSKDQLREAGLGTELPDHYKNYMRELEGKVPDDAKHDPTLYGRNAEGGVVMLNPMLDYKDPETGQMVKLNLRIASEISARRGVGYSQLSPWEQQQARTLKALTNENTAAVMGAWSKAYRELFLKYGDYINWKDGASGRQRGPRDLTKHYKFIGDLMHDFELNPGEYEKLRMLGYFNQVSILQAFSAGSMEDYLFAGLVERVPDELGSDVEKFKNDKTPGQLDYGGWFNRYKYVIGGRGKGSEELRQIIENVVYNHHSFLDPPHIIETMKKLKEKCQFLTKRKETDTETPETKEYLFDVGDKFLEFRTHDAEDAHMKALNARSIDLLISMLEVEEMINHHQVDELTKAYLGGKLEAELKIILDTFNKREAVEGFFAEFLKEMGEYMGTALKS